jgi:glutamine synthetase
MCNPYLGFSALMMAGLDGIINKIDPGKPLDKNIYDMSPEQLREVPSAPGSLAEALQALENDHEFLLRGDVFSDDLIQEWVEYKTTKEVQPMQLRPHPYEFMMYYDA